MNRVTRNIGHHGKILWRGLKRMLYGAATAGLFALAFYGFAMIPSEDGYVAVCDFVGAIVTMFLAVTCVYHQGGGRKRKGGFEK